MKHRGFAHLACALAILFALPSLARADQCAEKVKASAGRLVFPHEGKKLWLGQPVADAEPADPAKLCEKSSQARLENKTCHNAFRSIRGQAKAYLDSLGKICREFGQQPERCAHADAACAARVNERGRQAQERALKLLEAFKTDKLKASLKTVRDSYDNAYQAMHRAFTEADRRNELARARAATSAPAPAATAQGPAPATASQVTAASLGAKNLEQAWASLVGTPVPTKDSKGVKPVGPLAKELERAEQLAAFLDKDFLTKEKSAREKADTVLATNQRTASERADNNGTITGGNRAAAPSRASRSPAGGPSLDQLATLGSQAAQAAGKMGQQGSGSGQAPREAAPGTQSPGDGLPGVNAGALTSGAAGGTTAASGSMAYNVAALSRNEGASLANGNHLSASNGLTGSTGAIRRLGAGSASSRAERADPRGSEGEVSQRRVGSGDAVSAAINASASQAGSTGEGAPDSPAPSPAAPKDSASLADLFAKFDSVATRVKDTMASDPLAALSNLFGGGGNAPPAPAPSSGAPSAPVAAVRPVDQAPLAVAEPGFKGNRGPASTPVGDYFTEPTAADLEAALRPVEQGMGFTIEEETLFRRVSTKIREKAGLRPVSQL